MKPTRYLTEKEIAQISDSFIAFFFSRKTVVGECWEWNGSRKPSGYGNVCFQRKIWMTNRFAWILANRRPVPKNKHVMHSCDNPACINPKHLSLATPKENMADMISKGRHIEGRHKAAETRARSTVEKPIKQYSYRWDDVIQTTSFEPLENILKFPIDK